MNQNYVFTSEVVTPGHPDKLCDQVSDAVLDHYLVRDPLSRVGVECAVATGIIFIAARFRSEANVDIPSVARKVLGSAGYKKPVFDAKTCSVVTNLLELSKPEDGFLDETQLDDAQIDNITAGQQATVFGFACDHTKEMIPSSVWLARKLARQLTAVQAEKALPYLTPDAKTQVGVEFVNGRPHRVHSLTLVVCQRSGDDPDPKTLRDDLINQVINPIFVDEDIKPDDQTEVYINPAGPVIGGGPAQHAGLTGRKSSADTYGGFARNSGTALSGKDPSRIDRIGTYAARYAAKNIVASGLADICEVQLSYCLGLAQPVSVQVETFGTGKLANEAIVQRLKDHFDFRPAAIIRDFRLRYLPGDIPNFYRNLASYGHVGRADMELPWERSDKAELLK